MRRYPLLSIFSALMLWCGAAGAQTQSFQITSGPTLTAAAVDSVTIEWSTNVPAGSTVLYGTEPNQLDHTAQDSWGGTNHRITLKNLEPNTTYYYQVKSGEALGSGAAQTSPVASFHTDASGRASAAAQHSRQPNAANDSEANIAIVAGPIPQRVSDREARVWWETNSPSSTILMYGTDPNNISQKKEHPWGEQSHSVDLTGLQPGAAYSYQVVTSDGRILDQGTFQTEDSQTAQHSFKMTHGPVIEQLAPDSVVVAWTTSAPSSSTVLYGSDPSNLNQKAEAAWGEQTHRVTIHNLSPSTRYYFQVQTGQAQGTGESLTSAIFPVTTEAAGQQARVFNTK